MSAIENWMKGKSSTVAAFAMQVALSTPEVSDALTEMRNQVDTYIPQPPICRWLNLYKNHRAVLNCFDELFSFEGTTRIINESENDKKTQLSPHERRFFEHFYSQPEVLFFLKVWAPCILHYKTSPTMLIRKARLGKVSAFEKLLRIDNSVLFDRKLSELFHQYKGKRNKQVYQKLLLAFRSPIPAKTSPKYVKVFASGIISRFSVAMGERLTEPEIRELFDAIAQDKGHGLQDEDLPLSPDSFAQAIRRESKKFKSPDRPPYKK